MGWIKVLDMSTVKAHVKIVLKKYISPVRIMHDIIDNIGITVNRLWTPSRPDAIVSPPEAEEPSALARWIVTAPRAEVIAWLSGNPPSFEWYLACYALAVAEVEESKAHAFASWKDNWWRRRRRQ